MKNKIKYTDKPFGDVKVVRDFLPAPEDLVFHEDTVKITIALSRSSIDFFKSQAHRNRTQYQKMIRHLLDLYARKYNRRPLTGASRVRRTSSGVSAATR